MRGNDHHGKIAKTRPHLHVLLKPAKSELGFDLGYSDGLHKGTRHDPVYYGKHMLPAALEVQLQQDAPIVSQAP
jgi:hypothetical protein